MAKERGFHGVRPVAANRPLWHNPPGAQSMSRTLRLLLFSISLLVGLGLGLLYGWVVRPVEYVDTAPSSLRSDYRTDYVLMVAEAFSFSRDPAQARVHLAALGPKPPDDIAAEAVTFAVQHNFPSSDIVRLEQLRRAMQEFAPEAEIDIP